MVSRARSPMTKILVIEDESEFRRIYRESLETDGYAVVTERTHLAGLDAMERHSPDMVLYDVGEENMDALDAMQRMQDHCPRIPVVLVVRRQAARRSFLRSAADAYVTRSSDTKPLRNKIRQLFAPEGI